MSGHHRLSAISRTVASGVSPEDSARLDCYEGIAAAARAMAAAARACDAAAWDAAWIRCEAFIERLDASRGRTSPGTPAHRRRVALLRQIIAHDAEIERIRHPAYARLEAMLQGSPPEPG